MTKWDGAFRTIRRRSTEEIAEGLAVAPPFDFRADEDRSDIPDFIDASWHENGTEIDSVVSLPGRDVNYARDTLICAKKYLHVLESVKSQVNRGCMTWAMVDAYHAALLGTRLFGAVYGVLSYSARGRTVLIDYRPDLGSPDDVKAFKKIAKGIDFPIRVLKPQPKHLEQSDAWSLVTRLCAIARPQAADLPRLLSIKNLSEKKLSAFRNGILYDSVAWEWLDDFNTVGVPRETTHVRLADDDASQTLTLQVLSEMFGYMIDCLNQICVKIGFDIRSLSDLVFAEATPVGLFG